MPYGPPEATSTPTQLAGYMTQVASQVAPPLIAQAWTALAPGQTGKPCS
jgi:hypothetical protein